MANYDVELCKYQHLVDEIENYILENKAYKGSGYLKVDHLQAIQDILEKYNIIREEKWIII